MQSLEEKYKDQPHKLDIDGREIIWRDYVNKVERLLVIVGHVAGTFTTSPNPTVWSAINVLIKVRAEALTADFCFLFISGITTDIYSRPTLRNVKILRQSLVASRRRWTFSGEDPHTKRSIFRKERIPVLQAT